MKYSKYIYGPKPQIATSTHFRVEGNDVEKKNLEKTVILWR